MARGNLACLHSSEGTCEMVLKLRFGDVRQVAEADTRTLSNSLFDLIKNDTQLRAQIISIGIPILLPDGKSLLRGATIKIPPYRGETELALTPTTLDLWAHDGWFDLREKNMQLWRKRFAEIIKAVEHLPDEETSSRTMHNREYWQNLSDIDPGKICGWIFTYEEKGKRMKA